MTYQQPKDWESAVCDGCGKNPYHAGHEPPAYFASLDAMHEAEKSIPANLWMEYMCNICVEAGLRVDCEASETAQAMRHATAAHCAESFGRALSLW